MSDEEVAWVAVGVTFVVVIVLLILLLSLWKRRPLESRGRRRRAPERGPEAITATSEADAVLNRATAEALPEEMRGAAARAAALRSARYSALHSAREAEAAKNAPLAAPSSQYGTEPQRARATGEVSVAAAGLDQAPARAASMGDFNHVAAADSSHGSIGDAVPAHRLVDDEARRRNEAP